MENLHYKKSKNCSFLSGSVCHQFKLQEILLTHKSVERYLTSLTVITGYMCKNKIFA